MPKHSPKCDRDLCDPTDCDYRKMAEMTDQPYPGRNRDGDRPGLFRRRG